MKSQRRRRFSASSEDRFQIQGSGRKDAAANSLTLPEPPSPADRSNGDATPSDPPAEPAAQDALPPAFQLLHTRRSRLGVRDRAPFRWMALLPFLCLGIGLLAGYFLPRPSPSSVPSRGNGGEAKAVVLPTEAEQKDLDDAFRARHDGKFAEARQLFDALGRGHKGWGMMEVETGRTLLYENDLRNMFDVLQSALGKGYSPAEANFLIAARQNALRNFPEAEASFAKAVALDPTEPNYYYCWGECLRAQGKLQEAISKLRSALLRNQYETATGLYRLKLWLCEIEAGTADADGTSEEIKRSLSQRFPLMETLFAAAALSLKSGDAEAAVNQIIRVRPATDATVFNIVINDPVFAPIRMRPEVTALLQSTPNAAVAPATPAPAK